MSEYGKSRIQLKLFSEEDWKQSVCSSAIHLLAENRFDRQLAGLEALTALAPNSALKFCFTLTQSELPSEHRGVSEDNRAYVE